VEKELITLPEHLSSPPGFSGVRVTQSLVLCVVFVDRCLSICPFFVWSLCCLFFDLQILVTIWYLQTLLSKKQKVAIISFFLNEENTLWILISEADTKSTWTEAMTKCRQQCSTIESDTTILKQHYRKVDEKFWLPTAVYKTMWTEQLGMCI
jgi:hypothetical protein